jgi:hypothetical protein
LATRSNWRFQSNHHRGYFWPNRIISRGGRNSNPVPPTTTVVAPAVPPPPYCRGSPSIVARTIAIGITVKIRHALVRRFRSRSG